jgi:hypothetical protein
MERCTGSGDFISFRDYIPMRIIPWAPFLSWYRARRRRRHRLGCATLCSRETPGAGHRESVSAPSCESISGAPRVHGWYRSPSRSSRPTLPSKTPRSDPSAWDMALAAQTEPRRRPLRVSRRHFLQQRLRGLGMPLPPVSGTHFCACIAAPIFHRLKPCP